MPFLGAAVLCLLGVASHAQTFRGNLAGIVTDASGAVVANAAVTLESPANGWTRSTVSSSSGGFLFPELPVGAYTLTVTMPGFDSRKIDRIEVAVSRTTNLAVQLGVAHQQTVVEVSASAVSLDTSATALVSVVDSRTVKDLPVNGRDMREILRLAPGVTGNFSSGSYTVNGARVDHQSWSIDGADNNDPAGNKSAANQGGVGNTIPGVLVPMEAMDQFSVQTSGAGDMGGRYGGSNVNLVMKSGTNALHGSLYEFNRNEALAALSPLQNPGSVKQAIRNNQFGFAAGGPIVKNKFFFFLNGEAQIAMSANSLLDTVPSTAWVEQATAVLQSYHVPVNPVSMNVWSFYPADSRTGPATTNNYLSTAPNTFNSYNGVVKLDYRFTDRHTIFARYMGGGGTQVADNGSHFRDFFQVVPTHIHNFAVVQNDVLSPKLVNQLLAAVNYFRMDFNDFNVGFNPIAAGLNTGATAPNLIGSPLVKISGFDSLSSSSPLSRVPILGQITENLSYATGRHQMKFGGELRHTRADYGYFTNGRGTFSFDGSRGPWASDKTLSSSLRALADFIAGYPSNSSGATIAVGDQARIYLENSLDWWAHDTFQVNSQLSVNFGVRYTYQGEVHDSGDALYNFTPQAGFVKGSLYDNTLTNFAPRAGFAYSPKALGKTVIRGGYGIYHDVPTISVFAYSSLGNGGAAGVYQNPAGPNPIYALSVKNVVFQTGVPIFGTATPAPPYGVLATNRDFSMPYVQHFNLNVQRQITQSTLLQVAYAGSQGRHLPIFLDINQPVKGVRPFAAQYPTLGAINQWNPIAESGYSSLQASLRQQFWRGLTANLNYTWGHAIDNASDTKPQPENSYNLRNDKGATSTDVRHTVTGYVSYSAPRWTKFAPRLTNGWQFNSLFTASTGLPMNILAGTDVSATGENQDRPDLVGDPFANVPVLTGTRAVQYFNPAAFAKPAAGTYGNLGRNRIYGPGFGSFDFAIFKTTPITERIGTEFRVEIFNLTNRTNWANPTATFTSGSFGQLTQTRAGTKGAGLGYGEPRNVQLGLKITF